MDKDKIDRHQLDGIRDFHTEFKSLKGIIHDEPNTEPLNFNRIIIKCWSVFRVIRSSYTIIYNGKDLILF